MSRLQKSGYNVTIMSRNSDNLIKSVDALRTQNPKVMVSGQVCDISSVKSIEESVRRVDNDLGGIEVLVNAAGINSDKLLINSTKDMIHDIIETNLNGTIFMCKSILKRMIRQKRGSIVNIGFINRNSFQF